MLPHVPVDRVHFVQKLSFQLVHTRDDGRDETEDRGVQDGADDHHYHEETLVSM